VPDPHVPDPHTDRSLGNGAALRTCESW
jgi:hypothetical protein